MITIIRPDNRSFRFDAVLSPTISRPGVASQHPIAGGAQAADHLQKQLRSITFTGIVTEDPIQGPIPQVAGPERVQQAIEFLEKAREDFCTVVVSGRGIFRNCLIESLPSTQDRSVSEERFDITIVEMQVIESRSIRIVLPNVPAPAVSDEAPTTQDIGPQAPKPATPADENNGSFLLQLGQKVGVFE